MEIAEFKDMIWPHDFEINSFDVLCDFFAKHRLVGRCLVSEKIMYQWRLGHRMIEVEKKFYALSFEKKAENVYSVKCIEVTGYARQKK